MRATRRKVNVNSRTAIGLATSHEYSSNLDGQTLIFHFACTWHTTEPRVVSAARNTKHSTERRDGKALAFTMDEYEPHRFLLAKNSAAFFRISKSMSTRLCSRRKRMNSSRSSVVSAPAGPSPASILARCTHSRSAFSPMLRSLATRRDRAIPDLAEPNSFCFEFGSEGTTLGAGARFDASLRANNDETLSLRAFSLIEVSTKSRQSHSCGDWVMDIIGACCLDGSFLPYLIY